MKRSYKRSHLTSRDEHGNARRFTGHGEALASHTEKFTLSLSCGLLLCTFLGGCAGIGTGESGCAALASNIEMKSVRLAPSETFRVYGEGFADYPQGGGLLRRECSRPLPEENIHIEFAQGDRAWTLTYVDSNQNYAFSTELSVPAKAKPGGAILLVSSRKSERATIKLDIHEQQVAN